MTQENKSQTQQIQPVSSIKPMLVGAGIALLVGLSFLFGVYEPDPEWGILWMISTLLVTPLAGAVGGAFYSLINYHSSRGFNRTLAIFLSILVYFIALWHGVVLGFVGNMWDQTDLTYQN